MGMYSRNNNAYTDLDVNLESLEAIECKTENFNEAVMATIVESEINMNGILEAVGIEEYNYFEENGVEMVYESADIKGFFGKIKQWLMNLWQKIKGLFNKFVALFNSYAKTDKEFVNKYRKHLLKVNMKDFEYNGYEFDDAKMANLNVDRIWVAAMQGSDISFGLNAISSMDKEDAEKVLNYYDDEAEIREKMRGYAVRAAGSKAQGSLDASEYSKELFRLFRNDEESKTTIENIKIANQLGYIDGTKDAIKLAERSFKNLEKNIKVLLKNYDRLEKDLVKSVPSKDDSVDAEVQSYRLRLTTTVSGLMRAALEYAQIANGALLTALKDRNRQAKSICVAAMNYKPKNESTSLEGYSESGSFLDNVVIR